MELSLEEIRTLAQRLTNPLLVFDLETTGVDKVIRQNDQYWGTGYWLYSNRTKRIKTNDNTYVKVTILLDSN